MFHAFIFIVLSGAKGKKEHFDENDFRHDYGSYFEKAILQMIWYQLCYKLYFNNYVAQHLTVEDFTDMDQYTW